MTEGFDLVRDGDIARLTFARPEKMNAITHDMWSAIPHIVSEVENDPAIKVMLLSGAGRDFSAGADIGEFTRLRSTSDGARIYDKAVEQAVRALTGMRKPSIAAIRGNCISGGCQLAVACDFRFSAQGARFGITPAKLGIVYDFASTRQLISLVGPAHTRYLLLSGQLIDADRAYEIGLVNEVLADDTVDSFSDTFANTVSSRSQASVRGMNRIIEKVLAGQTEGDDEVENIRSAAVHGADYAEGVSAFLERRAPNFTVR